MPGSYSAYSASLYCVRPGLRCWKANTQGKVLATLVLKSEVQTAEANIKLLSGTQILSYQTQEEKNFGLLYPYINNWLISYNSSNLYILNSETAKLVGFQSDLGNIMNLCVCGDEIFILRESLSRPIIRLSLRPLDRTDAGLLLLLLHNPMKCFFLDLMKNFIQSFVHDPHFTLSKTVTRKHCFSILKHSLQDY